MIFKYARWKNIGPFGNEMQEVSFLNKDHLLWLVLGTNGVGKSYMIKILKIGTYHEYGDVKIGEIANQINKKGYIEISLQSNGHDWVIESEFSPNKVRVYKDGSKDPEDWGGIGDTKKRIREEIIDIPYYIFNNAISLSLDDFKSFLHISPKDSRRIRDRIFGFYVVNEMNELLKPYKSEVNSKLSDTESKIENTISSKESSMEEYKVLRQKLEEKDKEEVEELEKEKEKMEKDMEDIKSTMDSLKKKHNNLDISGKYVANKIRISKKEDIKRTLEDLDNQYNIAKVEKEENSEKLNSLLYSERMLQIKRSFERLDELEDKHKEHKDRYERLSAEINDIEKQISDTESRMSTYDAIKQEIKSITSIKRNLSSISELYETLINCIDGKKKGKEYLEKNANGIESTKNQISEHKYIVQDLEKKISAYKEGKCSECGTDLDTKEHKERLKDFDVELKQNKEQLKVLEQSLDKLESSREKAKKRLESIDDTKREMQVSISSCRNDIHRNADNLKQVNDKITEKIKNFISKVDKITNGGFEPRHYIIEGDVEDLVSELDVGDTIESIEEKEKKLKKEADVAGEKLQAISEDESKEKEKVISISAEMDMLNKNLEDKDRNEVKEIDDDISEDEIKKNAEEYEKIISSKEDVLDKMRQEISDAKSQLKSLEESIESNNKFSDKLIEALESKLKDMDLGEAANMIDQEKEKVNNNITETKEKINELDSSISVKESSIKKMKKGDHIDDQLKSMRSLMDRFDKEIKESREKIEEYTEELNFFEAVQYTLSDEGIKSYILSDIVPAINNEIARILDLLSVQMEVMFDEEFKVHIRRFGEEVSVGSISTGQSKMIDCAILMAITTILRMRYEFNVTFYDEILSSIHSDNRVILLDIIGKICCEKLKLHTFIINHSHLYSSYFGRVISIKNQDGFSNINEFSQDEYNEQYFSNSEGTDKEVDKESMKL